jgi:heat shock protein HtpX
MVKRVMLFLLTNILVIATISTVISLLGLHGYLTKHGIDYQALAIFCLIWGMGGAFISLLLSKIMAKYAMGVQLISQENASAQERRLIEIVHSLARKVGLNKMPEVGIYDSPEPNAFATGPSKNRALVAVSTGLLTHMNEEELEGVLGHEISHVANGDMITMTLIQGVVNSFALFLSRIVAYAISTAISSDEEEGRGGFSYLTYMLLTIVLDILFTVLGSIVTAAFSRWREYRADAGGAKLSGKAKMIKALESLKSVTEISDPRAPSLNTLKISQKPSIISLFSSHPSLENRIERLQRM